MTSQWAFAPTFSTERREFLESVPSFTYVIERVIAEAAHVKARVDGGSTPGLLGCRRPVFTLKVRSHTVDAFYNSPHGYRAQFLENADSGQAVNCIFVDALFEILLGRCTWSESKYGDMPEGEVKASLTANSAKVWIDENDFPFDNLTEDLAVEAWKAAAHLGILKAKRGLCAPEGTRLKVFGAFLTDLGHEIVPAHKIRRRYDLHSYGFS